MNFVFKGKLDNTLKVAPYNNQNSNELSDEVLVKRFVSGSRISYELLVLRYKQRIFEFIYFQIKQHNHDAEDLTQEVFVELYKKAGNFRNESKFSTYLFSIAKNIVLNYFRAKSRRFSFFQVFSKSENEQRANLQEQHLYEIEQQQVTVAINGLNADERQIIYLCDKEGFSYEQISEILNIKIGTVRSRLNAARKKVFKALKESNHEM